MSPCICVFPSDCGGLGMLLCDGCGGDLCVCHCGGQMDCEGCDRCSDRDDDYLDVDGAEDDECTAGGGCCTRGLTSCM